MDLKENNDQEARAFIDKIHKHVILKFDFDGVIVDSEMVAASVTVRSINNHLTSLFGAGNFEPLTIEYVCRYLSGLNFEKQQIPQIELKYGITFSDELKTDKKIGNLAALREETEAIHGIAQFFAFIRDHHLNAIGVTQSDPDRVIGTLSSPMCAEVAKHLGTSFAETSPKAGGKILLLSAGSRIEWNGRIIEKLKPKPDPEGYNLAHEIANARYPELNDIPTIVFEDSETGAKAAFLHINTLKNGIKSKIAIVSLGGHVSHDLDHISKMLQIIPENMAVVINHIDKKDQNPWVPGAIESLKIALLHACITNPDLPQDLPKSVISYVVSRMNNSSKY